MNSYRINTGYAKALLMLATDRGVDTAVDGDMKTVDEVCAASRELRAVFANPTVRADKKVAVAEALFADRVGEETMAFLRFVIRKNRAVNMRGICQAYMALYRESHGIMPSDLVTCEPIDDEARATVVRLVEEYTGKKAELHDHTDPKMLGGFKLEFDHKMYDARIRTKIRKLQLEFAKNDYESKL